MDEFLLDRVKELRQIRENLGRLERGLAARPPLLLADIRKELEYITRDVEDRIRAAEAAYAEF